MDIEKEFGQLSEKLKQQRDEIKLQIHLAGMEVKEEWENTEKKWAQFMRKVDDIGSESKETTDDFIASTRAIGAELRSSYERFAKHLPD